MRLGFAIIAIALSVGCSESSRKEEPPKDHPYYPSSIIQNGDTLFVLSSNFDQRYKHANVVGLDLTQVDAAALAEDVVIPNSVVTSSGIIPSFADGAALSLAKDSLLYLSREENSLRVIPLGNSGRLIACDDSVALGQDCFSGAPAAQLNQNNPYYLTLFPSQTNELSSGLIGYILDPVIRKADAEGKFQFPAFFEFERFTWNTQSASAEIEESLAISSKLRGTTAEPPVDRRYNSRVGNLFILGDYVYFLTQSPQDGGLRVAVSSLLVRVPLVALENGNSNTIPVEYFEFPKVVSVNSVSLRQIAGFLDIFVAGGDGLMERFGLDLADPVDVNGRLKVNAVNRASVCNHINDIELTPNMTHLVVACEGGRILVYDADTLDQLASDPASGPSFGRGALQIHFDTRSNDPEAPAWAADSYRFYTANFGDGSLSVFDLAKAPTANQHLLARKGRIFQPSRPNREGGAE